MKKINSFNQTAAMKMDVLAKSMTGKVYNLAAGDPNLDICEGLREAYYATEINTCHNYGSSQGLISLRKKIWDKPEEVIISNGAKQLIYMSLAAIAQPGDEIVIAGPCWASYMRICEILGLNYKLAVGSEKSGYIPDVESIEKLVSNNTAAILVNNPNNPTGRVYTGEYINAIYETAQRKDCRLIVDEIYRYLNDKPDDFVSMRGRDGVIVIDGYSKSLNITGWRLGYAIGERDVITSMVNLQSQMSGPPSTLIQTLVDRSYEKLTTESYDCYRDRIDELCRIDKFRRFRPEGTFYFYVPISDRWKSSEELCEYLLTRHRIFITPGDDYGVERTVRISVAAISIEELREITEYLKEV